MQLQEQINQVIEPIIVGMGYDLWGLECIPCRTAPTIKIYIDKEPAVSIDDCQNISRSIGRVLQVKVPFSNFSLEVSSPGLDRKLFSLAQYKRVINKVLQLSLRTPVDGQRNFKGRLLEVCEQKLRIEDHADPLHILLIDITDVVRARLIPEVKF